MFGKPSIMFGFAATPPLHLPLPSGQSLSVEVWPDRTAIEILNNAGPQERSGRGGDRLNFGRDCCGTLCTLGLGSLRFGHRLLAFVGARRNGVTLLLHLALNDQIHQSKTIEGILGIQALALIERTQMTFTVAAGKRCPAQQHWDGHVVGIERLEIRLHHHHAFDQESRQPNRIRLML